MANKKEPSRDLNSFFQESVISTYKRSVSEDGASVLNQNMSNTLLSKNNQNQEQEFHILSKSKDNDEPVFQIEPKAEDKAQISTIRTSFSFLFTNITPIILFIPYLISCFGILLGVFFLVLYFLMSIHTCVIMMKSKNLSRQNKYNSIARAALGPFAEILVWIAQMIHKIANCVILLLIGSECLSQFIRNVILNTSNNIYIQEQFIVLYTAALFFPLIFVRKIDNFFLFSVMRAMGILVLLIALLIIYTYDSDNEELSDEYSFLPQNFSFSNAFSVLPAIIMCFSFHDQFFWLYQNMRNPSDKQMTIATVVGNMFFLLSFMFTGLFGYLVVGSTQFNPQKDIIANMPGNYLHILIHIVEVFFFVACFVNFPSSYFDAKTTLKHIYNIILQKQSQKEMGIRVTIPNQIYFVLSGVLFILISVIAFFTKNQIIVVICLCGVLGSNFLSFILPNIFYIRLSQANQNNQHRFKFSSYLILFISVGISITCLWALIISGEPQVTYED